MTAPFLRDFSTHIAAWAQALIDDGRYPFRRAELCTQLLLNNPAIPPPLVFWINRDSFMAGGVILFATGTNSEESNTSGRELAAALGLGHFIVWERTQITFWSASDHPPTRRLSLPTPPSASANPREYQSLLVRVLQELKLLCVAEILAPAALAPSYFANLFFATIDAALPTLCQECRLLRATDDRERLLTAEHEAEHKAHLSLLRLVTLAGFDRLPPAVQPEGLEQASRYALETLPAAVQPVLAFIADELPLGNESTIRYHHLFRRLTQLEIAKDKKRIAKALELLAIPWAATFGGFSPPPSSAHAPESLLLVNSDRPGDRSVLAETGATPLLALYAVIRALHGDLSPRRQSISPLLLGAELRPDAIVGTLFDRHIPTGRERLNLTTRLRSSWPGRRWRLPTRTPRWVWELIHLLGLAPNESHINLTIPGDWLAGAFTALLLDLLCEDFAFERISATTTGNLSVHLCRRVGTEPELVVITAEEEERRLPFAFFGQARGALLALALLLPAELFALISTGKLQPQRADTATSQQLRGMELFCHASLGHLLWSIVSARRPLPTADRLSAILAEHSMPLPDAATLSHLAASLPMSQPPPSTSAIDRELSRWIALETSILPCPSDLMRESPTSQKRSAAKLKALEAEIIHEVFCDGVPRFPEHYLLDYFRPPTHEFMLSGVLSIHTVFFDTITLLDADGASFTVEGMETARALVLASHCTSGQLLLPTDRHLTSVILTRYQQDLRRLHQLLRRRVYLALSDPRQADTLCSRIWNRQALPPATLLDF